jgi:mRNA interferase MazF
VALQGDFGKPRPVLVLQHDAFNDTHATVTVALLSSHIASAPLFRITLDPSAENGLEQVSQIQLDKMVAVNRDKLGPAFGSVDADTLVRVNRAIALWLGLA